MNNFLYYLTLSYCRGIGPMALKRLLVEFKDIKTAYNAEFKDLQAVIGPVEARKFIKFKKSFDIEKELKKLKEKHITVITIEDKKYPQDLKNISDPPICIYIKGDLDSINFKEEIVLGIVGTREPTTSGIKAAQQFAYNLSEKGFVIISGMARGIDGIAHKAALDAGGKTIAVLGGGVDIIYPIENAEIYEKIINGNGFVISEFPPGYFVQKGIFVARNRLISGLSRNILLVEGRYNSGAIHTAHYALEQGKDVFVIPGSIYSQEAEAPNGLLMQGATPVLTPDDLAYDYGYKVYKQLTRKIISGLPLHEQNIYATFLNEPQSADELSRQTKLPIYQILSILSSLEIKGIIEKNKAGLYQLI